MQQSLYLQWLVLFALRWSLLPSPAKMHWAAKLCRDGKLPCNDALALGLLVAMVASPHSPVADRQVWNVCSHICDLDFELININSEDLEPVHCFWLGVGLAFDEPCCIFLSHQGTETKMDLVAAVTDVGISDWVFLDCLTWPNLTDSNHLFLWQNLWASSRMLIVDSPNFYQSKWCCMETAAFDIILQIFPNSRSISCWSWHGHPVGSDVARLYYM